jgi:predicted nucleic acid-binding protein
MTARHFIDTNILIYSISANPADGAKRDRAVAILDREDGALSVQVLQEFYVQATRPTRKNPLSHELACSLIDTWRRFAVQEINLSILNAALAISQTYRFSYWDSAIIAAARALGCRELYTEDLTHGREIEQVLIVNPFR